MSIHVDTSHWVRGKDYPNWMDQIAIDMISKGYLLPDEDVFDANRYIYSFINKSYDLKENKWFVPNKFDYILTTCNKEWKEPTQEQKNKN